MVLEGLEVESFIVEDILESEFEVRLQVDRESISGGGMGWAFDYVLQAKRGVVVATSALHPLLLD